MGREKKFPLILASASPRRRELLQLAGIPLEVIPSRADESFLPGESPDEHVRRVARVKAMDVGRQHPGRWVLGADTVVAIDGKVLGKPGGPPEAEEMLRELSRREHRVLTGFCILRHPPLEVREGTIISRVKFKPLSEEEIRWYIKTGEPFDKAGGYAIQGKAAFMVEEVHGSYTNIVGLPLCEVVEALRNLGAVNLFLPPSTPRSQRKE
jgi:septum formation protein